MPISSADRDETPIASPSAPNPTTKPSTWGEQALRTTYLTENGDGEAVFFDVNIAVPFSGVSGPAYDAINIYYQELLQQYRDALPENLENASGRRDALWHVSYFIPYESPQFVGTAIWEEWFAGGVWPINTYYAFFDKETGIKLTFDSLFTDPDTARQRILPLLEAGLYERFDWRAEEMLSRAAEFLGEQFYITDEGICLYYNVYDIGAYADGDSSYLIPYEVVEDILRYDISAFIPTTQTYTECWAQTAVTSRFQSG